MRTHLTRLREALALLLVGSAILFIVGSTIERNHRHHETTAAKPAVTPGENGSETGGEGSTPSAKHAEAGHNEVGVKILGVNTESLALSIVAVVLSLLLAIAVLARVWARLVLLAVAAFALVFAAGDGRELVHQLDESNAGLATVAGVLIGLHLIVALLAAFLFARRTGRAGSPLVTPAS